MQNKKNRKSEISKLREQCESNIIGTAILSTKRFKEDCLPLLRPECFEDPLHRQAYILAATAVGAGMNIDLGVMVAELTRQGNEHHDMVTYLAKASSDELQSPGMANYYTRELLKLHAWDVAERAAERVLIDIADCIPAEEAVAKFRLATENCITDPVRFVRLDVAVEEVIQTHRDALASGTSPSFSTPYEELDDATGGVCPGQLFLVSAVSFTGKTHFALRLASHFADQNIPTLFACLEMRSQELAERYLARTTRFDAMLFANHLLDSEELDELEQVKNEQLAGVPLYFHCSHGESASDIAAKARYAVAKHGIKVLFVDHLQRLTINPRRELRHELKDACKLLKNLALELDIAVVLLTQLKSEEGNKEPTMASYSEGKQIIEEADNAILLHRPAGEKNTLKVIVNKARKRSATEFFLRFNGKEYIDAVPEYSSDFR